jgi:hypothetical protein
MKKYFSVLTISLLFDKIKTKYVIILSSTIKNHRTEESPDTGMPLEVQSGAGLWLI